MLAPAISAIVPSSPLRSAPAPKPRLLLVADSTDRLKILQTGISTADFEITKVSSLEDLRTVCRNHHDLAMLDVSSAEIKPALAVLRKSRKHAAIPVLVASARLQNAQDLAGVLPAFRAMACNRTEMLALIQSYGEGGKQTKKQRAVLL
jgi:CheY-like chemotaxis protein